MSALVFNSLVLSCLGVCLVWALRLPLRRLFGAEVAYAAWLLPLSMAAVAWLPSLPVTVLPRLSALSLPTVSVSSALNNVPVVAGMSLAHGLVLLWLLGAGLMLLRLAWQCACLLWQSKPLPEHLGAAIRPHLGTLALRDVRLHAVGPAVCWLPGCRLLLPADLQKRFSEMQLAQVLAHECAHLRRRDPIWSLLAELMLAALWFFPPAWLAISRFRLDQELACDAAVLRASPEQAGDYARALLAGAMTSPPLLAVTSPWLTQPQLKERLIMIQQHSRNKVARRSGYFVLTVLLSTAALLAHAAIPAADDTLELSSSTPNMKPVTAAMMVTTPLPKYPREARVNLEEGTVILEVLVDMNGFPGAITVDESATNAPQSLVTASMAAVAKWRFNPALDEAGQARESWVRVPIEFYLDDMDVPVDQK